MKEKRETTAAERFAMEKAGEPVITQIEKMSGKDAVKDIRVTITFGDEERSFEVHSALIVLLTKNEIAPGKGECFSTISGCACPGCATALIEGMRQLFKETPELQNADARYQMNHILKILEGE